MHHIHNGVWPTMITPFTDRNEIDYDAVEKLLMFYQRRGVAGVFAVCQSSEMFKLDLEEKKQLIRFVVERLPDGMQAVVSGHTADNLDDQAREAEAVMCEGAAAYVVLPNRFAGEEESDDRLIENMEAFSAKFPDIPLGMYECPYPYKRVLSPRVLRSCVDIGRFLFIKDTCSNVGQMAEKLSVIEGSGIKLFNANSATLLDSLKLGASGYSGVMANFHPQLYAWLCRNYAKEPGKAERLQRLLGACSMAEYQYYPVNAKYSLSLQGVTMAIDSRVLDADLFAESKRLEIRQLNEVAAWAGEMLQLVHS
ncbi:dihydrodipicolinate synthase family protein [Paenibacillus sp. HB172176]|uniref:dihydrodipicolinate synthase family protein n=1 Tax=Paenibacillus sp. HB172176 TaxID=2493690 RepID=UPI00143C72E2|nr:dihydrodipicolinate synthase family protein [Paenibacillus sp. HB172176]